MNAETSILSETNDLSTKNTSKLSEEQKKKREKFKAILFLSGVTGVSMMIGFSRTIVAVRKQDPKSFNEGITGIQGLTETGGHLAMRALAWGTFYACTGCSVLFYGIWKLSGATSMQDFRVRMGNWLPKIPKNDPPQSRTEFKNLTDFLKYVSEDWGKSDSKKKSN